MLSRELLYTALTRQTDYVVLLHQGEFVNLRQYTDGLYSSISRRMTNLFSQPSATQIDATDQQEIVYMESRLIHRTSRGVRVRSKSELALTEKFDKYSLDWEYERQFNGRLPDFTIYDSDVGRTIYWEHLGMLHVPQYAEKWEAKRQWYLEQGVLAYEEDDGLSDILVTTRDDERGGLDLQRVEEILEDLFGSLG
jgi:hypothetical protein